MDGPRRRGYGADGPRRRGYDVDGPRRRGYDADGPRRRGYDVDGPRNGVGRRYEDLADAWDAPFASEDPRRGGCAAVPGV